MGEWVTMHAPIAAGFPDVIGTCEAQRFHPQSEEGQLGKKQTLGRVEMNGK